MKCEQEAEKITKEQKKNEVTKRSYDEWVAKKLALERERKKEQQRKMAEKTAQDKEVCLVVVVCVPCESVSIATL